jgi:hypothetical protein
VPAGRPSRSLSSKAGSPSGCRPVRIRRYRHYVGVMHLKLVRSGGLAGLTMVASLDSADLAADQQGLVAALLTQASGTPDEGKRGGADQFSYHLEIHQGERTVQHHWDEPHVPENVRPLLAALVNEARPAH